MKEIIVKTQEELNNIDIKFDGYIYIEGGTIETPLELKINFENAIVITRGQAVINMRESSQVGEMRESSKVGVMREGSQVGVMREGSQVGVMWGSSKVGVMREGSQVGVMRESSQVGVMMESSKVGEMREGSQVGVMWGSSQVGVMMESSKVGVMWGSSQVGVMWGSSQVELFGEAFVSAYSSKSIVCHGYNIVRLLGEKKDINLKINKESHLIIIPKFEATLEDFKKRYPTKLTKTKGIFYKAVKKINDKYISSYNSNFEYIVGKFKEEKCDTNIEENCSFGIHISDFWWAKSFGSDWDNLAILEVETNLKDIVIPKDTDGKLRTSRIKVLREVPKEEWFNFKY